jgi:hypothetical protein
MFDRGEFLAPSPRRFKVVPLADGNQVRIRNLTELEKAEFEASVLTDKGDLSSRLLRKHRMRLIVACVCDDQGNQVLTDADLPAIGAKDGAITTQLADECRKHCGFDASDLEDLVKNSGAIGGCGSPTDCA